MKQYIIINIKQNIVQPEGEVLIVKANEVKAAKGFETMEEMFGKKYFNFAMNECAETEVFMLPYSEELAQRLERLARRYDDGDYWTVNMEDFMDARLCTTKGVVTIHKSMVLVRRRMGLERQNYISSVANKINYRNDIAPKIIEDARKRIFNTFREKGYINKTDSETIESIEDYSVEICSSISMKVTGYAIEHYPDKVNQVSAIYSSILAVLVGMELTNEWAKGNTENPLAIYDEMLDESPIDIMDEYLLEKIGIEYQSEELNELSSLIRETYMENWAFINEEAQKQGIGTQIMFVVDSLMIMLSIGIQMEKKRLGI